jgi:hypothetical protein
MDIRVPVLSEHSLVLGFKTLELGLKFGVWSSGFRAKGLRFKN